MIVSLVKSSKEVTFSSSWQSSSEKEIKVHIVSMGKFFFIFYQAYNLFSYMFFYEHYYINIYSEKILEDISILENVENIIEKMLQKLRLNSLKKAKKIKKIAKEFFKIKNADKKKLSLSRNFFMENIEKVLKSNNYLQHIEKSTQLIFNALYKYFNIEKFDITNLEENFLFKWLNINLLKNSQKPKKNILYKILIKKSINDKRFWELFLIFHQKYIPSIYSETWDQISKKNQIVEIINNDKLLLIATEKRNISALNTLIDINPDFNIQDENKNTSLHIAAKKKDVEVIEKFLKKDLNMDIKNHEGKTPLEISIELNDQKSIKLFLKKRFQNININIDNIDKISDENINDLLLTASTFNDKWLILGLLHLGANINTLNEKKDSPLHIAAIYNNSLIISEFIKHGFDINIKNSEGKTPLEISIENDAKKSIALFLKKILKDHNININKITDENINDLLLAASKFNDKWLILGLLHLGADINTLDKNKNTPLHIAAKYKNNIVISFLIKQKAIQGLKNDEGETPFEISINQNDDKATQIFLNSKLENSKLNKKITNFEEIDTLNKFLFKVVKKSEIQNSYEVILIIKALVKLGADINAKDNRNNTLLHYLVENNNEEIIRAVCSLGADFSVKNTKKKSALMIAAENQNFQVLQIFINHQKNTKSMEKPPIKKKTLTDNKKMKYNPIGDEAV